MKIRLSILLLALVLPLSAQHSIKTQKYRSKIKMNYFLYLPDSYDSTKQDYPLVLFLHGGGESGSDPEKLTVHGPPKMVKNGIDFPFIILAPQNPYERKFWPEQMVMDLLDEIIEDYRVDRSRIYLTGLSRGAYGAWTLAMQYPDYFAAMIPISGAVPLSYYFWLPDIPIWIFHGEDDDVISAVESINMFQKLRKEGWDVKLKIYSETGHDAWTKTFENQDVWDWLLQQSR